MDMLSDQLRVHQMLPRIATLGPGKRFVIWTQGCRRRCPGCITPESWPMTGGRSIPVSEIAEKILSDAGCDGITISGGEPFLQARALVRLTDLLHEVRDIGVIVYTGYTLEELQSEAAPADSPELLKRIDLLIDGTFEQALDDGGSLRGSSNQRILPLTDRYLQDLHLYGQPGKRETEVRMTPEGFFVAGIPSEEIVRMKRNG